MKNVPLVAIGALIISLAVMGFQCSPGLTSAKMAMKLGNWAEAERHLEQETAKNPANAEAWYMLGTVRREQKNYKGMTEAYTRSLAAEKKFEKQIQADRLAVWVLVFKSGVDAYLKGKKAEEDSAAILMNMSVDYFNTALAINPDSSSTYTNLGLAFLEKERQFQKATQGESGARRDSLQRLALNSFEEAIRNFETSLQKEKDPGLAASVANLHLEKGRKFQKEAQDESGSRKESLLGLSKNSFNKAIGTLEQARQWASENQNILGLLLDAYIAAGRTDEAMNNFKLAVDKSPNNKMYRYNYGVLLIKADNHRAAVEQFEAAVVLDPKFEDALYNLGVGYLQWGAKLRKEAEAAARGSKEKQVSRSYEQQFRKGRDNLERLRDLKPDDPDVWEALGQAYGHLNMQKQAMEAFAKADSLRKAK